MDLVARLQRSSGSLGKIIRRLRRWRAERHEADALRALLDKQDDRLLTDAGVSREAGHRLLDETMLLPGRAWDRWQL